MVKFFFANFQVDSAFKLIVLLDRLCCGEESVVICEVDYRVRLIMLLSGFFCQVNLQSAYGGVSIWGFRPSTIRTTTRPLSPKREHLQ